jgi:OmpA-OmpF porin, OOP family
MIMKYASIGMITLWFVAAVSVFAQEDAEGCKDHSLFTRFPNMHINSCDSSQFDLRKFPVGPPNKEDQKTKSVDVEGPTQLISYEVNEGVTKPSGLQIMRNFENAAKKAGATIEGQYPGWCKAGYDPEGMPGMGNGCMSYALTIKFIRSGKETWLFLQASDTEGNYVMTVSEREAMKQEVRANEMAEKLVKEGFIAIYVNFDTGKATITPDSAQILDDAAAAIKAAGSMRVEVAGHTDNVGTPEANQRLSEERAKAVMAAIVQRGIQADQLTAKGYGQTAPIADNRTEEGRSKNRRVELVKK